METIAQQPNHTNQTLAPKTPRGLWELAQERLLKQMAVGTYKTWIEPLKDKSHTNGRLILAGPNSFFVNWVKNNFLKEIMEALTAVGWTAADEVIFTIEENNIQAPELIIKKPEQRTNDFLPGLACKTPSLAFNRRFTFETFVVGDSNRYAFSAAQALAQGDTLGSDSLFITSDHGLGKSHLSQALGQSFLAAKPGSKIYYLTAEDFTNEMTQSIRNYSMENFKQKYRQNCDVLVLEEVQFLAGKEKIQTELCFTLDCLMERGKKVIFTSPEEPRNIPRLGRSLRSRLSGSIISPIGAPDFDTRLRILEEKARNINLKISRPVLEHLAERITSDVRQLESALISLGAKSRLLNRAVDMEMANENLTCLFDDGEERLTPIGVRSLICRYFQVAPDEILSKVRHNHLVEARSIGMYLSRSLTRRTLGEIGQAFGRTHSSTLYAISKLERQLKKDSKLQGKIELLTQKLVK